MLEVVTVIQCVSHTYSTARISGTQTASLRPAPMLSYTELNWVPIRPPNHRQKHELREGVDFHRRKHECWSVDPARIRLPAAAEGLARPLRFVLSPIKTDEPQLRCLHFDLTVATLRVP